MSKLKTTKDARTAYDRKSGAVRSIFGSELISKKGGRKSGGKKAADEFLEENKKILKLDKLTLGYEGSRETSLFQTHRYYQVHNGVEVYGSRVQVAIRLKDSQIVSNVNKVDYDLPKEMDEKAAVLGPDQAVEYAARRLGNRFKTIQFGAPRLYIYRHKEADVQDPYRAEPMRAEMIALGKASVGKAYLVWRVTADTKGPTGYWEILIDATRNALVSVRDRRRFATRQADVFWPDPITSSQDTSLSWSTSESTLNDECVEVTLENLNAPSGGVYKLEGSWVKCVDRESPDYAQPQTTGDFKYGAKGREFLSVMAYHYLDRLITQLRSFGITDYDNDTSTPIEVDAQGFSGDDNSHFVVPASGTPYIAWGEGGVPDASDPGVIYHEYGHALHHYLLGDSVPNSSYEEGFNDFLSCCFRDRYNDAQFDRANVFPWDNCPAISWSTYRRCDLSERFDDAGFSSYDFYKKGNVYATALWDIYLNIGGSSGSPNVRRQAANEMLHMYMEMLLEVGDNEPPQDLAMGLIQVDEARTGGLYKKVIWDAFRRRGLWTDYTPEGSVDVYIRDSSSDTGEHASPAVHWQSPDIWVRNNPPDASGENPDDGHQHPINNVPNYLYVRVRNRGSAGAAAGAYSVDAFHCDPATGMLWPDHFVSMGTLNVTSSIASSGSTRVGPFIWTPNIVDHECLVAVVHGAGDPAIPHTLTQTVDHWKIVRFDNNVGQRNVSPQPSVPGGKVKTSLVIRGGTQSTTNSLSINAVPLPDDTSIEVRVARSIADNARELNRLDVLEENTRYARLTMNGGGEGIIRDFPLAAGAESTVTLTVDFSYRAEHGKTYPMVITQIQDTVIVGRLTIDIVAIKETEDYVYANPRSRELHTIHCPFWNLISQKNKIPYPSVQAALAAGYDGCAYCLSAHHTD